MILKRISILNYKNLEQVEIGFSAKLNCFFGQNGMGKTNLLDAVYFLSFCKSSGNPIDSQNIRHEQDFFVIQGFYEAEVGTVAELLEEIESENLYQVLVTVDGRTLKIVLLKMQGYSTKEIAPLVHLTTGAIYARLDHLRKKLRKIL